MTEHDSTTETEPTGETFVEDFDAGFDDWIAGATIARRSIPIYADGGLMAEYQDLLRQRELVEEEVQGEPSQADTRLDDIDAQLAALYEKRQLSKATWIVRALDTADHDAINDVLPAPEPPERLTEPVLHEKASPSQREAYKRAKAKFDEALPAHEKAVEEYEAKAAEYVKALNLQIVYRGVDEIRFPSGRVQRGISYEQVEQVAERIGRVQIGAVVEEINKATSGEVDIPAPFSQSDSQDART